MNTERSPHASLFCLDPAVTFLNHGSFGACPRAVLEAQSRIRARLESEPVRFMVRELPELLEAALTRVASFVGAPAEDLAFVPNATSGVNAVLRSLELQPGDELLVTDQEYQASRNCLDFVADRAGAKVIVVAAPFPMPEPEALLTALESKRSERTRLLLIDHITSPTGMVLPIAEIASHFEQRGVEVLIDGAHAIGMVPLTLEALGASYYTTNCHKWLCSPKGAALLYVRGAARGHVRPTRISHGMSQAGDDTTSRFRHEFSWTGTQDPSAYLSVPTAIDHLGSVLPGGWPALMQRNRALALSARDLLCAALGVEPPCPDSCIGALAALPLPDSSAPPPGPPSWTLRLQDQLFERHKIEVPIVSWPTHPRRLVRISAQLYNDERQYRALAEALLAELEAE
jgi:isopenicillin-N epimerase